jgi:Flp pilus assembly pilin Flp
MTMEAALKALWRQEEGQDLIEYTLLIAFITFATASLFLMGASGNLSGIWTGANNSLASASSAAS